MKRLTERGKDGYAFYKKCFKKCGGIGCVNAKCSDDFSAECCQSLAAYEDLIDLDHLRELVEAEKDGRWIEDDTVYCGAGRRWYKCSSCNERVFTALKCSKGYMFCPFCGAHMIGVEE